MADQTAPPTVWATDTIVSLPEPSKHDIMVNFGTGLGFTKYGINHAITMADIEDYTPTFIGKPDE